MNITAKTLVVWLALTGLAFADGAGISQGSGITPGEPWVDDGSTLTPADNRDVDVKDDSPHLTLRDTTDNTAFQLHHDSAETYSGFTLWTGTDAGNAFAIGTNKPSLRVDTSGGVYFPNLATTSARCLELAATSGALTLASAACGTGGSGDSVTVNTTAIDTTANFKDTTTVTWAVVDGGAGGPDDAQATAVDVTCTDCLGTTEIADSYVLNTGDAMTGDLDLDGSNINLTLQHTGADEFGLHTEAGSIFYINNATDGVEYWQALASHRIIYGETSVPQHTFVAAGTGNAVIQLPADTIGVEELDTSDAPADEECATYESADGRIEWQTCGSGGGDSITVNSSAATDPDFANGDVDWTLTGGNSITATVGCSGCIDSTDLADTIEVTAIEIGHASDTTLARSAAGKVTIESAAVHTNAVREIVFRAADLELLEAADSFPAPSRWTGTNLDINTLAFDASTDEGAKATFQVPTSDLQASSTITFRFKWFARTATTGDVIWNARCTATGAEGESWDTTLTTVAAAADTVQGTANLMTTTTVTETLANLGWAAGDTIACTTHRDANAAGDTMADDAQLATFTVEIPLE